MSDEQFPCLDWPQSYVPSNSANRNLPRGEDTSQQPFYRSPYYGSSLASQTQLSNNNGLSQHYPTYQQNEIYVRPEDMMQYPPYYWPPASSLERQTYHHHRNSPVRPTTSHRQQSPKRPAPPQLSSPVSQTSSGKARAAGNMDSTHDAKRRRIESPVLSRSPSSVVPPARSQPTSQAPLQTVSHSAPKPATPPISQNISRPVSRTPTQSVAKHVPPAVRPTLPPSRLPPGTTPAPSTYSKSAPGSVSRPTLGPTSSKPAPFKPPPVTQRAPQASQTSQAPHPQRPPAPFQSLTSYSFQPKDPLDKSFLKRRTDIVGSLKEEDAAIKISYDPNTIARDVLIATGRHPTEPRLNHHLFRLRDVFSYVDVSSNLDTFRWDLVDPKPSRDDQHKATSKKETAQPTTASQLPFIDNPPPRPPLSRIPGIQNPSTVDSTQGSGYSQKKAQHLPPAPQAQAQPQQVPQPPAEQSNSTPQPKMAGRGRPGRPPGSSKAKVVLPPAPTVSYPVFACRWGNCQSELHNLEMLKKHIFKTHVTYQITCGWKGCTFTRTLPAAELFKHVKKNHLDAFAWELGDGPSVPTTVDGRTVPLTIPESNQPGSEDSLIFPASYSSIRAFNRVHGNHTQYDKAREILKAVQRLKEHIGVGLDHGGCEIATPARMERVSNDEDVYEVRSRS